MELFIKQNICFLTFLLFNIIEFFADISTIHALVLSCANGEVLADQYKADILYIVT